jgi:hypothetical protein
MAADANACAVVGPVAPAGTRAVNYAFDVTPARLVAGTRHRAGHCAGDECGHPRDVPRMRQAPA